MLHPAATDALYFVANGTGGHSFARTWAEHLANVARWRAIEASRAGGTGERCERNGCMRKASENDRRGLMLAVSSPSGAGKTTLCRRLIAQHSSLALSVSVTTSAPRPGEKDGREYHFVSPTVFQAMAAADAFLEWAEVHGHRYGTPRSAIEERLATGWDVLFDVDWQGAAAIAAAAPLDVVRVFVLPPSLGELAERLKRRAQDDSAVIERRLAGARGEIGHFDEYDWLIVNDDLERAYGELAAIYAAERLRPRRNLVVLRTAERLLGKGG